MPWDRLPAWNRAFPWLTARAGSTLTPALEPADKDGVSSPSPGANGLTLYTSHVLRMWSNKLYRSLRRFTTCQGELREHSFVNPAMSEKKIVGDSKCSGSTDLPAMSCYPMKLKPENRDRFWTDLLIWSPTNPSRVILIDPFVSVG